MNNLHIYSSVATDNLTMSDSLGHYEEVEEVEVSDNDPGIESAADEEPERPQGVLSTPAASPSVKKPGRVSPTDEVKNMKLKSPESPRNSAPSLPAGRNPFPTFGQWSPATMSEVEIQFPVLTGKNESTNELTRETKPEARYWKAPIVFKHGAFTSNTLRFDNVPIPYHTGKGYGSNFVYMCLPGFAAEKFADAGKSRRPTVVTEKSLQRDPNRWWKVANNVTESFGVINRDTKKFHKKSLETIFDATSSGVTATVVLSFLFKANTDSKEPLKATTAGTISVELERAYLSSTDVNVEMPVRLNTQKRKVDPAATSRDVADDALMKRLADLGL